MLETALQLLTSKRLEDPSYEHVNRITFYNSVHNHVLHLRKEPYFRILRMNINFLNIRSTKLLKKKKKTHKEEGPQEVMKVMGYVIGLN
jgi:hypothetical protein